MARYGRASAKRDRSARFRGREADAAHGRYRQIRGLGTTPPPPDVRDRATARARRAGNERDGAVPVAVTVDTRIFGPVRGTVDVPVTTSGGKVGVTWTPHLRLPGLRAGETVKRVTLAQAVPASVVDPGGL